MRDVKSLTKLTNALTQSLNDAWLQALLLTGLHCDTVTSNQPAPNNFHFMLWTTRSNTRKLMKQTKEKEQLLFLKLPRWR